MTAEPNTPAQASANAHLLGAELPSMVTATSNEQIPKSLLELDQWICWRYEWREGRLTKVPIQTNGRLAETDNPATWTSFEDALAATRRHQNLGLGFVFAKGGGIAGVDLDKCLDEVGRLKPWAQPIVARFGDTYCEISPSGTGVKIFCRGNLEGLVADTGTRRKYEDGQIEAYQHTRFFAVTGRAFNGAPLAIEEHRRSLEWLVGLIGVRPPAQNGSKSPLLATPATKLSAEEIERVRAVVDAALEADGRFKALFEGGTCGFPSASEADLSFCDYLAGKLKLNADQIDAAFRMSKRISKKWDTRHFADGRTYGQATIARALVPLETGAASHQSHPEATSKPLRFFPYTDSGNAERIIARHGRDLHYCHPQKTWYIWDSKRWIPDEKGALMAIAKSIARLLYQEAGAIEDEEDRKACAAFARKCESSERRKAALVCAQSEPGIPILPADFDTDQFLLNCLNGTIDLHTGELRQHRRGDLFTKLAPVQYDPAARSTLWEHFLDEATEGDRELQDFLQRAVGYSLTGDVGEEKLFFVHGPGGSGKSTFLESVKASLGDYAKTADFETFVQRNQAGGVRDDVAELAGRRFVVSIEVEQGKKLAQGLVKLLTGGDTVRARFLYQQGFEFLPQFKLWLAANDAPKVNHDDSAMWRRILRIPFDRVIPKENRDPSIKKRLKDVRESGPAILAWAVEGCHRWREEGLGVPTIVEKATEQYRLNMDPLRDFITDCCVLHSSAWITTGKLRSAYEDYCKERGEKHLMTPNEFAAGLRARGCESKRRHAGAGWLGIGLLAEESTPGIM